MQNNKHIVELRKKLKQFANIPFYSVVVFYGNCVLKDINFVPSDTFLVKSGRVLKVLDIILRKNEFPPYTDNCDIVRVMKEAVLNGNDKAIQTQHIENINEMLGKHRIFN